MNDIDPHENAGLAEQSDGGGPRSDALVVFGLNGDLGGKKLYPALVELAATGRLGVPVIGVGRREVTRDELRDGLRGGAVAAGVDDDSDAPFDDIDLRYVAGDVDDDSTFTAIAEELAGCDRPTVYAALPPDLMAAVAAGVHRHLPEATRLVVEKPFGDSAEGARRLYDEIVDEVGEDRLFIVDHFLAKSAVENLLTVRTSNRLFDTMLRAEHVDSVEVEMLETGDADGRGDFYESVGAIDDVVQSHVLQILALLTMEPPTDRTVSSYHAARSTLLGHIVPVDNAAVVLGQYSTYRSHEGVADDSSVETYADLVTSIDTDRWRGVPIRIRTGKALDVDATSATVHLRDADVHAPATAIRFVVKPESRVELDIAVLDPQGEGLAVRTAVVCGPGQHLELSEYAVMFDDVMCGNGRRFASIDDVVAGWAVVDGIERGGVVSYETGSGGPDVAVDGPWRGSEDQSTS